VEEKEEREEERVRRREGRKKCWLCSSMEED